MALSCAVTAAPVTLFDVESKLSPNNPKEVEKFSSLGRFCCVAQ
jgi:hypothetical protein